MLSRLITVAAIAILLAAAGLLSSPQPVHACSPVPTPTPIVHPDPVEQLRLRTTQQENDETEHREAVAQWLPRTVERADLIVLGTVIRETAQADSWGGQRYTSVISVEEVIAGEPTNRVEIPDLGAFWPDCSAFGPRMAPGERVLLFLRYKEQAEAWRLILDGGKFVIEADTAYVHQFPLWPGIFGNSTAPSEPRPVREFIEEISDLARATPIIIDDPVTADSLDTTSAADTVADPAVTDQVSSFIPWLLAFVPLVFVGAFWVWRQGR